jgi:predicted RNase H-like HicB family nuclease
VSTFLRLDQTPKAKGSKMNFPVIIHKDKESDYGVIIPDLPGCFSAGDSYEDALANTREAIECHIEGLLEGGEGRLNTQV